MSEIIEAAEAPDPYVNVRQKAVSRAFLLTEDMAARYLFDDAPLPDGLDFSSASSHPKERRISSFYARVGDGRDRQQVCIGDWVVCDNHGRFTKYGPLEFDLTFEVCK